MYHLWAKVIKNHRIINSIDIKNNEDLSTSEKFTKCINEIFYKLDLSQPIFLSKHEKEFREFKKLIFFKDDFVDEIDFDRLEIELIDDGDKKKKEMIF